MRGDKFLRGPRFVFGEILRERGDARFRIFYKKTNTQTRIEIRMIVIDARYIYQLTSITMILYRDCP